MYVTHDHWHAGMRSARNWNRLQAVGRKAMHDYFSVTELDKDKTFQVSTVNAQYSYCSVPLKTVRDVQFKSSRRDPARSVRLRLASVSTALALAPSSSLLLLWKPRYALKSVTMPDQCKPSTQWKQTGTRYRTPATLARAPERRLQT